MGRRSRRNLPAADREVAAAGQQRLQQNRDQLRAVAAVAIEKDHDVRADRRHHAGMAGAAVAALNFGHHAGPRGACVLDGAIDAAAVDDDDVVVFIDNGEIDCLRLGHEFDHRRRFAVDDIAFACNLAAFDRLAVDTQIAIFRGSCNRRARQSRPMREDEIDAFAGVFSCDGESQVLPESKG